jgi:transcriptional regulator with XRE-family HTH domain
LALLYLKTRWRRAWYKLGEMFRPKLRHIRGALNLTQEEMAELLRQVKPSVRPGHVSELERGLREPTLLVLLRYARLAGVSMESLVDDKLDVPEKLTLRKRAK